MHQSSYDKMALFKERFLDSDHSLSILDLGSQDVNGSYRDLFEEKNWRYTGMDMVPGKNVDLVVDNPYCWKELRSCSYDVVVSGQALEHIRYFWVTMLEIFRVLNPGGMCCLLAPSSGPEHRYPVDCWRIYPDGFSGLARFAQMDVLHVETQWQDLGYQDGSDVWHDSMLVGQRPRFSPWIDVKARAKNRLQHLVLSTGLPGDIAAEQ
ncbi:methyltransferase domain-containing protein [uncultured Desulfuromonas sp.]|uniref:class I SAM-dependent methyltransferase n=1 Tax=uncultured Desulfuromonas sp. TaxID=181013 RepID=UPI002AABDFA2|nr:methyltransferase domain-containing protein [uncultured Desulfuromonas sp.]